MKVLSIKYFTGLLCSLFLLPACGKRETELTPAQIRAKADSIVQTRMEKIKRQAKEDLDKRLPIELKPKIDSILKNGHGELTVPVFPDDNTGMDDTGATTVTPDSIKK